MAVVIEERPFPGPPRRRLTEDDRKLAESVARACRDVERATRVLDVARARRKRAVGQAFEAKIHPLDLMAITGMGRRTIRDWQAQWVAEQVAEQARRA